MKTLLLWQEERKSNHSEICSETSPLKRTTLQGERLHQGLSTSRRTFSLLILMMNSQRHIWGTAPVVLEGACQPQTLQILVIGVVTLNQAGSIVELCLQATVIRGVSMGPRQTNQRLAQRCSKLRLVEKIPLIFLFG